MLTTRNVTIGLWFLLLCCCKCEKKKSDEDKMFKATHEWKTIQDDDILPVGLHYRVNLVTGKKEAKLMTAEQDEGDQPQTSLTYDKTKIENIDGEDDDAGLQSIRNINDDILGDSERLSPEDEQKFKKIIQDEKSKKKKEGGRGGGKFRNYDELKSAFDEMNMTVETEANLLNKLFDNFDLTQRTDTQILNALQDFDFLVSQIDNAKYFAQKQGITKIIFPCLNASNFNIKIEALKVLGSAVQNNIQVQILALEQNTLQPLLHLFNTYVIPASVHEHLKASGSSSGSAGEGIGNTAENRELLYKLQTTIIYAISCLMRNFPTAQNDFFKNGGLDVLLNEKIFQNNSDYGFKVQLKIAAIINYLLHERLEAAINLNIQKSKLKQFVDITSRIKIDKDDDTADDVDEKGEKTFENDEMEKSASRRYSSEISYEYNLIRKEFELAESRVRQYDEYPLEPMLLNLNWCHVTKNLLLLNDHTSLMGIVLNILVSSMTMCDQYEYDSRVRDVLLRVKQNRLLDEDDELGVELDVLLNTFAEKSGSEKKRYSVRDEL